MDSRFFRKYFLLFTIFFTSLIFILSEAVFAKEEFPIKPIKIIVGYGAGSTTDLGTRVLGGVNGF
jgi:tripartite-type tricarboxylate transporter receptor subunit TctC